MFEELEVIAVVCRNIKSSLWLDWQCDWGKGRGQNVKMRLDSAQIM